MRELSVGLALFAFIWAFFLGNTLNADFAESVGAALKKEVEYGIRISKEDT